MKGCIPDELMSVTVSPRTGPSRNGRPVIDGILITLPNDLVHIERGPEWNEVTFSLNVFKQLCNAINQCEHSINKLGKLDYIIESAPHGDKLV